MTNINLSLNLNTTVNLNFDGVQGTAYPLSKADQENLKRQQAKQMQKAFENNNASSDEE